MKQPADPGAAFAVATEDALPGRARRTYNQWVANETLEDFALRFTARRARKWSPARVANTAIGSISFLALEAIGATLTLSYGFANAVPAILIVGAILFLTAVPISVHAARHGVDIDLLTRGAGFGYIGSTVTSLIYASFTFIFFALEAAILSQALELWLGVPLWAGYLLNALIVIPLVTHGFTRIGAFQKVTQPLWVVLHAIPFVALALMAPDLRQWTGHEGRLGGPLLDPILFATACGVAFALMAQIGEQVDFLRFLPEPKTRRELVAWWAALLGAGPGWAVLGTLKMLAGSFLAVLILGAGVPAEEAIEPTKMYLAAYEWVVPPEVALLLTVVFVVLSQLKINVTNAYAGSIAWSNFFSRLTHSHPGRVVWLVFNVAIALVLMQFGVFEAIEGTLTLYGHVATAWIAAITADLVINKPLGLSPKGIEFRRSHLHDINPVGTGATALGSVMGLLAYVGAFGATAAAFSSFIALGLPFAAAPAIAVLTRSRYYLARQDDCSEAAETTCTLCDHAFDPEDMTSCPFHGGAICSLCCALEVRCRDVCRPEATAEAMGETLARRLVPEGATRALVMRYGWYAGLLGSFVFMIGMVLLLVHRQVALGAPEVAAPLASALSLAFGLLVLMAGVVAWLQTLSRESRHRADEERERQTHRLMAEIRAHRRTDAELQRAKDRAEAANDAKSRYVAGMSHEIRTPLNAILGYAQLLEHDPTIPRARQPALRVIRRSSEHLADLIESLLDISKIEAGRLEISRAECSLRDIIEQMAATFQREAEEKGLTFRLRIGTSVPDRVHADVRRLRQILTNLLSNAVRYTDRGEVEFEIAYRNEVATFTVRDSGRGIAAADHSRIFEPFIRIEDPKSPVAGTGLGLTISRLLVDLLGGELVLKSTPGEGSTFTMRVMLPNISTEAPSEARRRIYGYRGPRKRILVVDDNADHRLLLEAALRPLGFVLIMAENAETALELAAAEPPDLALVDVSLPGTDGWTLAEALRRDLKLAAPILIVSALAAEYGTTPDRVSGPHDDFLAKPFDIDALHLRIERLLRLEWVIEVPAPAPSPYSGSVASSDLAALSDALAVGHVRGATIALSTLRDSRPEAASFVEAALPLLERIDLEGLERLVAETRA
jgi:signal transduction histidine kinase/CheY-like chemotaxis protein/purine-cytosine permease-like protein